MPHAIEEKARKFLIQKLTENGSTVVSSDKKTFDLIVDGKYAEIKAKNKDLKNLDFISLSDKQYQAARAEDFSIYLVCNLLENNPKIYKISSSELLQKRARIITSYEFDRSILVNLCRPL